MIALWMLAATLVAVALGLAAAAAEHVARMWRRPARHAWTVALLGALLLPTAAALLGRARPAPAPGAAAASADPTMPVRLATIVVRAEYAPRLAARLAPLDRPLGATWLALAALALALVARGASGLARARRSWRAHEVDGTPVLVTDDVGPAVVGLRRPAIVLPEWALALDAPLRALVVRHEQEHVRARDPLHLALGALGIVLMPWNPGVWWQLRRLRAALEIDCDARVLAAQGAHRDVSRYGLLLLAVAQRRATASPLHGLAGAPALAESTSDLSRRIHAMRSPVPENRVLRTVLGTVAAAAAVALAAAACAGSRDALSPNAAPRQKAIEADKPVPTTASADSAHRGAANPPGVRTLDVVRADEAVDASSAPRPVTQPRSADAMKQSGPPQVVNGPYFEFQVEKPVAPAPGNMGPRYPDELRAAKVEGTVYAAFVVDTTGLPIMDTFKVMKSDHPLFTQAVRTALAEMKFVPAMVGDRKVKQLVQAPFQFSLSK
ncbi:TonB family protein [Gemmatirosa kalamazoonensis]|uniref:TonB family protein n=1 Tax=Gemmatirosa kalamazoonensis TaxID=861299 RepID=W0RNJ7_9BACT|nr:M56 family metallopeptidase [Gemmatirosa kalamazoonensis]AHG92072.1 TonB family protein [Gemmatirosa kalamazoonensis]